MEFINKKTKELSEEEKIQICQCYEIVFDGHKKKLDTFNNQFLNTCLGYSFHTMLKNDEGVVVGNYAVIPFDYVYRDTKHLFCIGLDFMIRKDYRNDFKNVMGLCGESMKYAKANGISCIFAFPNDLSHQLNIRILRMKDVGKLYTYVLPYKVGDAKPTLKILNILSKLFSLIIAGISYFDCRNKKYVPIIHRNQDSFEKTRYKWFNPDDYRFYKDDKMSCSWKCADFEGVRAAFLLDVYPMTPKNFNKAVRVMFMEEKKKLGVFLYVGNLQFTPISMLKIPLKVAPKNFNFVAQVLDKKNLNSEDIFNMDNWDINLSSYDLL